MPRAPRFLLILALLPLAALPACTSSTFATGRVEPLTAQATTEIGCSPLMLTVFGREEVGGGSGIAVHERIILTAGHVVPRGARWLTVYAAAATDGHQRGGGARIRRVIRGDGEATSEGDWALLILDRSLARLGATPAPCLCIQDSPKPRPGDQVLIAGYPFDHGAGDAPPQGGPAGDRRDRAMFKREPVVVRTAISSAPPGAVPSDQFLYASYVPGRKDFSGLSGGPVFLLPHDDRPPTLIGIHIATGVSTFAGTITLGRTSVIRRVPVEAIDRAIADLERPAR